MTTVDFSQPVTLEFTNAAQLPTIRDVQGKFGIKDDEIFPEHGITPLRMENNEPDHFMAVVSLRAAWEVKRSGHEDFVHFYKFVPSDIWPGLRK